jgi:hypothetical protein
MGEYEGELKLKYSADSKLGINFIILGESSN